MVEQERLKKNFDIEIQKILDTQNQIIEKWRSDLAVQNQWIKNPEQRVSLLQDLEKEVSSTVGRPMSVIQPVHDSSVISQHYENGTMYINEANLVEINTAFNSYKPVAEAATVEYAQLLTQAEINPNAPTLVTNPMQSPAPPQQQSTSTPAVVQEQSPTPGQQQSATAYTVTQEQSPTPAPSPTTTQGQSSTPAPAQQQSPTPTPAAIQEQSPEPSPAQQQSPAPVTTQEQSSVPAPAQQQNMPSQTLSTDLSTSASQSNDQDYPYTHGL